MASTNDPKIQEVKCFARYIHMSPRKLRLVADMIRNSNVAEALEQLKYSSKNAALPISKAIKSAIASAEHNFNLKRDRLFIKSITIDPGPVYKRMVPRAQGRGFIVRKRSSHINVVLKEKESAGKKQKRSIFSLRSKTDKGADAKQAQQESGRVPEDKTQKPGVGPKTEQKVKRNLVDLKRRLFNRKSG
jgi:large subunit ribosomal protein L22